MADIRSVHALMRAHDRHEAQLDTLRDLLTERLAAARAELAQAPAALRRTHPARRRIGELEAALDRMERGLYGICRGCGAFIEMSVLLHAPQDQECAECRRASERRAGRGVALALDLGTARTRTVVPGGSAILDRPSCVPSADGTAEPVWPIRHGMVASMAACHRLARTVLREALDQAAGVSADPAGDGDPLGRVARVLVGVPVAATATERRAVRAAVGRAVDCPIVLVEEPLAAAIGCGVDVTASRPRLLLDVGAGIIEAVVITDAAVAEAGALQVSCTASAGLPGHAVEAVTDLVADLVRRLPPHQRLGVRAGGLLLTGGGAAQPDLAGRLGAGLRLTVHPAARPAHATIRGLTRLCLVPELAERVTASEPIDIMKGSV